MRPTTMAAGRSSSPGTRPPSSAPSCIAQDKGAKRAVMLPVSAPFHCALMQPAADAMREALAAVTVRRPGVPLVANVTAAPDHRPGRDPRRRSSGR